MVGANSLSELVAGSKTDDDGVKNAMMKALHEVVEKAGGSMSEASRNAVLGLIDDDSSDRTGKSLPFLFDYRFSDMNQMQWL